MSDQSRRRDDCCRAGVRRSQLRGFCRAVCRQSLQCSVARAYLLPAMGSLRKALMASRLTVSSTSGFTRSKHTDTTHVPTPGEPELSTVARELTIYFVLRRRFGFLSPTLPKARSCPASLSSTPSLRAAPDPFTTASMNNQRLTPANRIMASTRSIFRSPCILQPAYGVSHRRPTAADSSSGT